MNEEIAAGLKNAMEHGASLEKAIQSFINAGYNAQDVRDAGKSLSISVGEMTNMKMPTIEQNLHTLPPLPKINSGQENKRRHFSTRGILIILLIILSLAFLGTLVYFIATQV